MAKSKDIELLPAYLVIGEDLLKRERVIKRLRLRLETLGDLSFNSDRFSGASASADAVLAACRTIPFASEKRLVVVEDVSKVGKKDAQAIADYLAEPVASTVLILIGDSLPKSSPLTKAVKALGASAFIDCAPPKKRDLPAQVCQMARTHGLELSPEAARALVSLVGESTVHIDEELKKLALANQGREGAGSLGTDAIRESVAQVATVPQWDFVDAFANRDMAAVAGMRHRLGSASPHVLLRQCVTRVREMACARVVTSAGGGDAASRVASELGLPANRAFVGRLRVEQSRRYSLVELERALVSAVDAERRMKGGMDPDIAFDMWLYGVMGTRIHDRQRG